MRIETNFATEIIKDNDPISLIKKRVLEIWLNKVEEGNAIEDYYYKGEEEMRDLEEFILKSYWEIYDILARACLVEKDVFRLYPEATIVVMDGMSIRESALLYNLLKTKYSVRHEVAFSAIPSDTEFFRKKIKKSLNDFSQINNSKNIRLVGNKKYIWSYFPDVMLDKIKTGHTVISSLEEMYKVVENVVLAVLENVNAERIVITSDHGYLRTEAGFTFSVLKNKAKEKLQQVFGGKRYKRIGAISVESLINEGYIMEFNGWYLAKSRYLWPVSGKFSIYIHGGLSLMECLIPVLEIKR